MRLTTHTGVSFVVLMAITMGLGACAAHKREAVSAVRSARDRAQKPGTLGAGDSTSTDASVSSAKWTSVLSANATADKKYALDTYDVKVIKSDKSLLIDLTMAASPLVTNTSGVVTSPSAPIITALGKDVKDSDVTDLLKTLPETVNEFSAKDGSVLTIRSDDVSGKDASGAYQDVVTLDHADLSMKVTADVAWKALQPVSVTKQSDGSIQVVRIVGIDEKTQTVAQETMTYKLSQTTPATAQPQAQAPIKIGADVQDPTAALIDANAQSSDQIPDTATTAPQQ